MRLNWFDRTSAKLLAGAVILTLGVSSAAMAATAAGTVISNSASVGYQVGGISQDTVTSSAVTFKVDRKVNLTAVTDETAVVSVIPGSSGNVLIFTLTNTGNDTFDYDLSAVALTGGAAKFGGTDNVNASGVSVFVESGANAGYLPLEDTATSVDDLAANGTVKIYIVASFATGLSNNDIASYHLLVTAKSSSGAALTEDTDADDPDVVENVFADGAGTDDIARDAKFSDQADYKVATASLTVGKTSSVVWDPVNLASNPKAIPGALVEYTVTITNGASASTATNVLVTDDLSSEFAVMRFKAAAYSAGKGLKVMAPNLYSGVETELTDGADSDQGSFDAGTKIVTVTGIQLAGGESATVKFQVEIQ